MFPKKPVTKSECDLCVEKFSNAEEVSKHKQEQHSPDSFYEKLVDDMTGSCQICKKFFNIHEIEDHLKSEHGPQGET